MKPPKIRKPRVAFGYISPGTESSYFSYCKDRAMFYERETYGAAPALIFQHCASGQLVEARNEVVSYFLDSTDVDWLLCVDADMGFGADLIEAFMAAAHPTKAPVVGALAFGLKKRGMDHDLQSVDLRCFPTLYQYREQNDDRGELKNVGFAPITQYPRDTLVQVSATGAACFVVHRGVLDKMRAEYGDTWFDPIAHPIGKTFGEDLSFFLRVAGVDFPVFVHTGIKTSHDKGGISLTEARWDEQEFLRQNYPGFDTSPKT